MWEVWEMSAFNGQWCIASFDHKSEAQDFAQEMRISNMLDVQMGMEELSYRVKFHL